MVCEARQWSRSRLRQGGGDAMTNAKQLTHSACVAALLAGGLLAGFGSHRLGAADHRTRFGNSGSGPIARRTREIRLGDD